MPDLSGSWVYPQQPDSAVKRQPELQPQPLHRSARAHAVVDADGGLSAGLAMAGSVSSVIPIMIIFLVFQRQFVAALASSGLK